MHVLIRSHVCTCTHACTQTDQAADTRSRCLKVKDKTSSFRAGQLHIVYIYIRQSCRVARDTCSRAAWFVRSPASSGASHLTTGSIDRYDRSSVHPVPSAFGMHAFLEYIRDGLLACSCQIDRHRLIYLYPPQQIDRRSVIRTLTNPSMAVRTESGGIVSSVFMKRGAKGAENSLHRAG